MRYEWVGLNFKATLMVVGYFYYKNKNLWEKEDALREEEFPGHQIIIQKR
jgi:hypothetical protein